MHSHEHDGASGRKSLTQADADRCCASSESKGSTRGVAAATIVLAAPVRVPLVLDPPVVTQLGDRSSSVETSPPGHVPRHVFLSVFVI